MMGVDQIKAAVADLSREDLARFAAWFEEFREDAWDRQVEADAKAGRLDHLAEQVEAGVAAGRVRPLL